jgi:uncharacterized protein (TIGR00288 family)
MAEEGRALAIFIDFENLALGFEIPRKKVTFNINKVLERLVEKGKIIVKRAYADWARFPAYKAALHESAIELIEIPKRGRTGKNSADIRMAVDAVDLCYAKEHIDTFVIVSGDSDFSPLVSKLKENGKRVIGLGMQGSTSDLLINNCDEFIFYEDLDLVAAKPPTISAGLPKKKQDAFELLLDVIAGLMREGADVLHSSMIKDTMKRKRPQFSESYHGYRAFTELLKDAQSQGLITLRVDPRSGTYVVDGFGSSSARR